MSVNSINNNYRKIPFDEERSEKRRKGQSEIVVPSPSILRSAKSPIPSLRISCSQNDEEKQGEDVFFTSSSVQDTTYLFQAFKNQKMSDAVAKHLKEKGAVLSEGSMLGKGIFGQVFSLPNEKVIKVFMQKDGLNIFDLETGEHLANEIIDFRILKSTFVFYDIETNKVFETEEISQLPSIPCAVRFCEKLAKLDVK